MSSRWIPHPRERAARRYRRVLRERDREPEARYGVGGYGYPEGYRGSYAERPGYRARRAELYPADRAEGSRYREYGQGYPLGERQIRAYNDRDLACTVDDVLHDALGPEAERIATYASDAVITLEGRVSDPEVAHEALTMAWRVPGVYRVRNALRWRR